jgi:hypothetical protein
MQMSLLCSQVSSSSRHVRGILPRAPAIIEWRICWVKNSGTRYGFTPQGSSEPPPVEAAPATKKKGPGVPGRHVEAIENLG